MKGAFLLSYCPKVVANTDWSPVITALPGICWGVIAVLTILAVLYISLKYVYRPIIANRHAIEMKKMLLDNEEKAIAKNQEIKDKELERKVREYNNLTKLINNDDLEQKIREYNELTIHQMLLEKATGIDKDINDLKKALEEMKKQYETLDGQIEKIIIKKNSDGNA